MRTFALNISSFIKWPVISIVFFALIAQPMVNNLNVMFKQPIVLIETDSDQGQEVEFEQDDTKDERIQFHSDPAYPDDDLTLMDSNFIAHTSIMSQFDLDTPIPPPDSL